MRYLAALLVIAAMAPLSGCLAPGAMTLYVSSEREEEVRVRLTFAGSVVYDSLHNRSIVGMPVEVKVNATWGRVVAEVPSLGSAGTFVNLKNSPHVKVAVIGESILVQASESPPHYL